MIRTGQLAGAFSVSDKGRYLIDVQAADALLDATRDESTDQQRNLFTGQPVKGRGGRTRPASRLGADTLGRDTTRGRGATPATFADANTLEKTYKAKLARLKYEQQAGELVPKGTVDRQAQDVGKMIRTRLEAIPARLAPTVAGMSDPVDVAERLRVEINQLLVDLSDDVSNLPFS